MHFSTAIIQWVEASKYVLVFILSIVEGPIVMISSGFLMRLNQFQLIPLYFALLLGDFAADIVWYAVGYFGARPLINKFGKFLNITPEIIQKIELRFKAYEEKILFISKITMGFGFALATLIVAGMIRVSIKKYAILNLLGGFIWTAFLLAIGYFFGNIYFAIAGPLKIVFVVFMILVIIIALNVINRYMVKNIK